MPKPITCFHSKVRRLIALGAFIWLAACGGDSWHNTDITGLMPKLEFSMTRAEDNHQVTAANYRGHIVLLYFGYTFCPDICPATLSNLSAVLAKLGPEARQVRVLFVTVDPNRDTVPALADYVNNFAPEMEGMRGTPDELASLARRYRAVYSVKPATKNHPYEVTHGAAVYVFDGTGVARLLISSTDLAKDGIHGTVE